MRCAAVLALALSVLGACKGDPVQCEQACRNFYTLKFWKKADAEIAKLPADQQEAARQKKQVELANELEQGIQFCVVSCTSANNDDQNECLIKAKTADEAEDCVD